MESTPKAERLAEFYRRLQLAPPVATFEAAYKLICETLDQVEDEFCGEPNEPHRWQVLDRMFPPQLDRMVPVQGDEVCRLESVRHYTYVAKNGAIDIRKSRTVASQFSKAGSDGRTVINVCPRLETENL